MYSPLSSVISTTYSQDKRITDYLKSEKTKAQTDAIKLQLIRLEYYENLEISRRHPIFKIPAINIMKFTSKKIKFAFQPSLIYDNISKTYLFHCSLHYVERFRKWKIGREPMPALGICRKVTNNYEYIKDNINNLYSVVCKIYEELKKWSEDEIRFRKMRFQNYKSGKSSYLDIDEVDEELYFSPEEIEALHEKRERIWQRMLPPPPEPQPRRNPERIAKKSTKYQNYKRGKSSYVDTDEVD
ncbi:unnamed protein product [Ceutorhynchus assimilis]|uniref:Uncharacterized protein n=1 Tax=Ceutorhynchus assimilis TaxID=467358 RepID=A0A9N9QJS2_9CUCU|nr:unnamed protein product [Ceutorhynchus assimilis]